MLIPYLSGRTSVTRPPPLLGKEVTDIVNAVKLIDEKHSDMD